MSTFSQEMREMRRVTPYRAAGLQIILRQPVSDFVVATAVNGEVAALLVDQLNKAAQ